MRNRLRWWWMDLLDWKRRGLCKRHGFWYCAPSIHERFGYIDPVGEDYADPITIQNAVRDFLEAHNLQAISDDDAIGFELEDGTTIDPNYDGN